MIRLNGISKRFDGNVALDGVSLTVGAGEVVGLIGPNGSGKTTLLGVASGVLKPSAGSVLLDGADFTGRGPADFAHAGLGRTFQQVRLFSGLSVRETVEVGAVAKGLEPQSAGLALSLTGLESIDYREAATLPYGLQREVEIARALAGEPDLLVLDEPAAGMNEEESDRLLKTIRAIVTEFGCGVLVVEHDLRLIMRLCDRIQVLAEGKTIAEGTPEEIRTDPVVIETYLGSPRMEKNETDN